MNSVATTVNFIILKYYEYLSQEIEKHQGRCVFSILSSLM